MAGLTITCAYCGGTDFTLNITLVGTTILRCVDHDDHVKRLDLPSQRALHSVMSDVEDGRTEGTP